MSATAMALPGVTQTILVGDPSGLPGNCLQAAVATLLNLPLDEVPHFAMDPDWDERLVDFMREHGVRVRYSPPGSRVTGIAYGPSVRGVTHAVVVVAGEVAWDPHPSRDGLLSVSGIWACDQMPAADGEPR